MPSVCSCTTDTIRRSSSIPKLARATDWTSRTTCLACLEPWARMWTSVGRPMSSVTTRAAETSGRRQSSRSSSSTSSSGPSPASGVVTASSTCCSMVRSSLRPGRPRTVAFRSRRSLSAVPGGDRRGAGAHPSLLLPLGLLWLLLPMSDTGDMPRGIGTVVPSYSRSDRLPNPARERSGRTSVAGRTGVPDDRREGGHRAFGCGRQGLGRSGPKGPASEALPSGHQRTAREVHRKEGDLSCGRPTSVSPCSCPARLHCCSPAVH